MEETWRRMEADWEIRFKSRLEQMGPEVVEGEEMGEASEGPGS